MSSKFSIIPADAIFDERLQAGHLRMLAALSYYGANRERGCWYSYKKMAEQLDTTKRTVMDYIKHLCDLGYVEKVPQTREDGSSSTNLYKIKYLMEINTGDGEPKQHPTSSQNSTGDGEPKAHPHIEPDKDLPKPNNKNKKGGLSIDEWEAEVGSPLRIEMIAGWVKEKGLCPKVIAELIEGFRIEMQGKTLKYADYRKVFQTYLTNGYLRKTFEQCLFSKQPRAQAGVTTLNRGNSI